MKLLNDRSTGFAWFGILGVAVFMTIWLFASAADPAWEFGVNTLSEFGISDTDAKLFFNFGCMITGILMAVFGVGRAAYGKNVGHSVGGSMIFVAGVALALVGVFTMDQGYVHSFVAVVAALFIFMAMIAIAAGNWAAGKKVLAGVGVVMVFMLSAMAIAYDVAMLEAYGIILAMIWFLLESMNMILSSGKD